MDSALVEEARRRSLDLLRRASHPAGFLASPSFAHYRSVWTRDAAVAVLGAVATGDEALLDTSAVTLRTLAARAGQFGQIPDAVWPERNYWDWGEAGATDASAWFVVVASILGTEHPGLVDREVWSAAAEALDWLRRLDSTNSGVIDSPPAGDWMDSSLMRSGRVFHVNLLYWWAADRFAAAATHHGIEPLVDPADVRSRIDLLFWPRAGASIDDLYDHVRRRGRSGRYDHAATTAAYEAAAAARAAGRSFYLSHIAHGGFVDRCDVLANVLAVHSGFVEDARARAILAALAPASDPYPSRSWLAPFSLDDDPWGTWNRGAEATIPARWQNPPHRYHNAAVWPYVGGFHVAALAGLGLVTEAGAMIERVAVANRLGREGEWGFHEWLNGRTGEPGGAVQQTWNAGALLVADAAFTNPR